MSLDWLFNFIFGAELVLRVGFSLDFTDKPTGHKKREEVKGYIC